LRQYIGIIRDHSNSMGHLTNQAKQDYNELLREMKDSFSFANGFKSAKIVTTQCGVGRRGEVILEETGRNLEAVQPLTSYVASGYSTPLFDSVGKTVQELVKVEQNDPERFYDPDFAFILIAVTDGEENSSRSYYASNLKQLIHEKQATDRWTFVFRVPPGYKSQLASKLGVHSGNVVEWEISEQGMQASTVQTQSAMRSYATARTKGTTSTDKFYMNTSTITQSTVNRNLTRLNYYDMVTYTTGNLVEEIRPFYERMTRKAYVIGSCFYELTKTETIQSSKKIIIVDGTTGYAYSGDDARYVLKLPIGQTIKVVPEKNSHWKIYVQSTSTNRKLMPNTKLIYYPNV
jgi:hypothetical protein